MARSFNGTSDHILTSSFACPSAGTLAAWVNPGTLSNAYNGIVGQSFSGTAFFIILLKSTGKFAYYLEDSSSTTRSIDPGTATASGWTHVAFSYQSSVAFSTYVNGASDGSFAVGALSLASMSVGVSIGYDSFNAGRNFPGSLADCAFWNMALTAAEITALSKGVRPHAVRPANLIGWWPLDGYGHPALDRTIYNNNGVLTGTSLAVGAPLINAAPIMLTTVNSGEAFLKRSPLMVAAALPKIKGAAAASSVVFRKTLSQIGGRVGTRQIQGWAN